MWINLLAVTVAGSMLQAAEKVELKDQMDKVSYGIGMNLGQQFLRSEVPIKPELLLEGMKAVLDKQSTLMTEEEMRSVLAAYQQETRAKMMEQRKVEGDANMAKATAFLATNKARPEVKTTASGLQYEVITAGEGSSPKSNDVVQVNYRGTLIDGTEFDSSYSRGEPAKFTVNRLVKGWTEALQLMNPGAKWKLYIPPDLAYGERGSGNKIPPNSALIFELELLEIAAAEPPAPKKPVTSDIIRVPSKEEMEQGAKVQILKKEDVERILAEERAKKEGDEKDEE